MIEVIGSIGRLRLAEEQGLNELLTRYGGSFEGHPWYRISWAPDDNKGLRKAHALGCPKTDPRDWTCDCPTHILDHVKFPICFDANQLSYHLLGLRIPGASDTEAAATLGDDTGGLVYECTGLHFVDEVGAPINPTESIIERVIPTLQFFSESVRATAYGYDAIVRRQRQQRIDAAKERARVTEARYDAFAESILDAELPAFGGNPAVAVTGPHGPSQSSLHESDAYRLREEREPRQ